MTTHSVTRAIVSLCLLSLSAAVPVGADTNTQSAGMPSTSTNSANAPSAGIQVPGAKTTLLLDAAICRRIRPQTGVAPDPFGNSGPVAVGDQAHHDEQKICLASGEGIFVVPADPAGQSVVFRLAVQGPLDVRIVFSTGKGSASHRATLAAEGKWSDVTVPLATIADRLGRGEKVIDITLFQKDMSHKGMLYLHSAVLATKPAP